MVEASDKGVAEYHDEEAEPMKRQTRDSLLRELSELRKLYEDQMRVATSHIKKAVDLEKQLTETKDDRRWLKQLVQSLSEAIRAKS